MAEDSSTQFISKVISHGLRSDPHNPHAEPLKHT